MHLSFLKDALTGKILLKKTRVQTTHSVRMSLESSRTIDAVENEHVDVRA